jgi:iron only hydrogenase large subunit-like protein
MGSAYISTNKAVCRDCYKCLRECPVKAIRMTSGQAYIDETRCVLCGKCVKVCPQNAKNYRNDVAEVKDLINAGKKVIASIAPSYAAVFESWEVKRLPAILKVLGFSAVEDASAGALYNTRATFDIIKNDSTRPYMSSACPAVVNYVEKYRPDLIDVLVPVVSPMIAHGKLIKKKYGADAKVVFIGPCIAKKYEAERPEFRNIVDAVLTFHELDEWISGENLSIENCEESRFDNDAPYFSILFPLSGGMFNTADNSYTRMNSDMLAINGFQPVKEACDYIKTGKSGKIIEPLFCVSGCIGGPGIESEKNVFERKANLLDYFNSARKSGEPLSTEIDIEAISTGTHFTQRKVEEKDPDEKDIKDILLKIGKTDDDDHLNCGACGYDTCREKAKAVLNGMAEVEMCIPYMRYISERRTDKIIESTPNGIVILNDELNVIHMNASFKTFFNCNESLIGKKISVLMSIEPFEELAAGDKELIETTTEFEKLNLVFHILLYKLKQDNQIVGIFVDITKNLADRKKLVSLRAKTLIQAQELLEHQIEMAQKLAKFLGESTAKGESLVDSLMSLTEDEEKKKESPRKNWLWDTYMLK